MTSDAQEAKPMHLAAEIFFYPFHFTGRAIVRLIRLLAAISALAIASAIIFIALFFGWQWAEDRLDSHEATQALLVAFALLASLGLLATAFTKAGQAIRCALSEIREELRRLSRDWVPPLNVAKSFGDAKKDALAIGRTFGSMYSAPYKIILPLSLIVFLTFAATHIVGADAEWKKGVTAALDNLDSPTIVLVLPAEGDPPIPVPKPRPGTTFAIAHVEQGSLKTGRGICLDDNISLPWLTAFKKALTACGTSTPKCRPKLVVKAFASIAPIRGDDGEPAAPEVQEELNCEIANRRAEEVVDFLRLSDYECEVEEEEEKDEEEEPWKPPSKLYTDGKRHCERKQPEFKFGHEEGLAFDLHYEPWQSHKAMVAGKPADDGGPPPRARRPDLEFFNRSVQLTVHNYHCDPEQCASAAPPASSPSATEGSRRQAPASPAAATTRNTAASAASN